ncbi:WD40/YVTN/BNR-like repeat-containing protein [Longispora albida]|uniref:WD40/YVTN/BNR-like repeat-containing protein n=1 Tax=Longispora albida TaxID=203523 RepID=UPI000378BEBE|nr:WD40 repeat domain-containing protein [Longispora albida]
MTRTLRPRRALAAAAAVTMTLTLFTVSPAQAAEPEAGAPGTLATQKHRWRLVGPNGTGGELAFTKARPDRIYVATQIGNVVFRSDDRGTTWTQSNQFPVEAMNSGGISAHPSRPDVVFAGGQERNEFHGFVLRSTDAGKNFTPVLDLPAAVTGVVVDPSGSRVYATTEQGVYVSTDLGGRWNLLPGSPASARYPKFEGADLFFAAGPELWVIRQAGAGTPRPLARLAQPSLSGDAIGQLTISGDTFVARSELQVAHVSTDRGRHWRAMTGPWGKNVVILSSIVDGSGRLHIQVNQETGEMQQWGSRDGGRTWKAEAGLDRVDLYEATGTFPGRPGTDVISAAAGIYTTSDHQKFERIGVPGSDVFSLAVTRGKSGPALVAGTWTGSFQSTAPMKERLPRGYQEWGFSGTAPHTIGNRIDSLATDPRNPATVYRVRNTCTFEQPCFYLEKSADAGVKWTIMQRAVPGKALGIAVSPADPQRLYVATHAPSAVYTSDDGGVTLQQNGQDHLEGFTSVALTPGNRDSAWLGGPDGLFRSTDGGVTLQKVLDGWVSAIAVDPRTPGHAVIAGIDALYVTWDDGKHITKVAGDLSGYLSSIAFSPDGKTIYAGSHYYHTAASGVLRSTDGGRTWGSITGNLPEPSVNSLVVSADNSWLFAGTTFGSVYRLAV